jgi:hypothetical protein
MTNPGNPLGNGSAGSLTQIANALQAQSLQNGFTQTIFNGWLAGIDSLKRTGAEIAAGVTPTNFAYAPGHVLRYGTNTVPGTTDMTAALNATGTAVGSGGRVIWPAGTYLTTGPILFENLRGITIQADSGQFGFNGTRIIGQHTGKAILSLVGSLYCQVGPVILEGNATTTPKTGLLTGRSSAASAGGHTFNGTQAQGNYTIAGHYNVASEQNVYINCNFVPNAAPSAGGLYLSGSDTFGVGGLTASSMECVTFIGGQVGSADTTAGSNGFWIDLSASTGHHRFYNTFFLKKGGQAFGFLRMGAIDGASSIFPIEFLGCQGEDAGTHPLYGLYVHNSLGSQLSISKLTAHVRFQTPSVGVIYCDGGGAGTGLSSGVQLIGADIQTPFGSAGTSMPGSVLGRCDGSMISLLSEGAGITMAAAVGSTVLTNAALTLTVNQGSILQTMSGSYSALMGGPLGINGVAPPAQVTGWGTPTGGAVIASFPGATATLLQCSEAIAQLIADRKAEGRYGV